MASYQKLENEVNSAKSLGQSNGLPPGHNYNLDYFENMQVNDAYWSAKSSRPNNMQPDLNRKLDFDGTIRGIAFTLGLLFFMGSIILILCACSIEKGDLYGEIGLVLLILGPALMIYSRVNDL